MLTRYEIVIVICAVNRWKELFLLLHIKENSSSSVYTDSQDCVVTQALIENDRNKEAGMNTERQINVCNVQSSRLIRLAASSHETAVKKVINLPRLVCVNGPCGRGHVARTQ